MKKEYLDPNFIGPILPPKNLTDEQKAAVVKVILRYSRAKSYPRGAVKQINSSIRNLQSAQFMKC